MFDSSVPRDKVPPSPVIHRRSSTDWVSFDGAEPEPDLVVPELTKPLPKLEDFLAGNQDFTVPTSFSGDFEIGSEKGFVSDITEGTAQEIVSESSSFDSKFDARKVSDYSVPEAFSNEPASQPDATYDQSCVGFDYDVHMQTYNTDHGYIPTEARGHQQPPDVPSKQSHEIFARPESPERPTSVPQTQPSRPVRPAPPKPPGQAPQPAPVSRKTLSVDDPNFVPPVVTIEEHILRHSSSSSSDISVKVQPQVIQHEYANEVDYSIEHERPEVSTSPTEDNEPADSYAQNYAQEPYVEPEPEPQLPEYDYAAYSTDLTESADYQPDFSAYQREVSYGDEPKLPDEPRAEETVTGLPSDHYDDLAQTNRMESQYEPPQVTEDNQYPTEPKPHMTSPPGAGFDDDEGFLSGGGGTGGWVSFSEDSSGTPTWKPDTSDHGPSRPRFEPERGTWEHSEVAHETVHPPQGSGGTQPPGQEERGPEPADKGGRPPPRPSAPPPRPPGGPHIPHKIAPLTGPIKIALPKPGQFDRDDAHEAESGE